MHALCAVKPNTVGSYAESCFVPCRKHEEMQNGSMPSPPEAVGHTRTDSGNEEHINKVIPLFAPSTAGASWPRLSNEQKAQKICFLALLMDWEFKGCSPLILQSCRLSLQEGFIPEDASPAVLKTELPPALEHVAEQASTQDAFSGEILLENEALPGHEGAHTGRG